MITVKDFLEICKEQGIEEDFKICLLNDKKTCKTATAVLLSQNSKFLVIGTEEDFKDCIVKEINEREEYYGREMEKN